MTAPLPLIVFTDIDGTLLDHETYRWDAAAPALGQLNAIGAGVVLASSKTAAEIAPLREELGLTRWPAIVENGGGLLPEQANDADRAARYAQLRDALDQMPSALRKHFRGFGDMDYAGISDVTGLPMQAAALAGQRAYSEPGLWSGSAQERAAFLSWLERRGITAREGGRFLTLSFGGTKADRMLEIGAIYPAQRTIALGDAPNDVEMLEAADLGIVITQPHRAPLPQLRGENDGRIIRTSRPGPEGWNIAMLEQIARLKLVQGPSNHG